MSGCQNRRSHNAAQRLSAWTCDRVLALLETVSGLEASDMAAVATLKLSVCLVPEANVDGLFISHSERNIEFVACPIRW